MADVVDDIKAKLDIVTLVSQYVQLKKAGLNYKGLCPFHSEKTPSFVVSPEKQICHCFGCNKGGDIFTFIQEVEGISFTEAIEVLADKAGVKAENLYKFKKRENRSEKDDYYKAHELAQEYFADKLFNSKDGKKVLGYLEKRGVDKDLAKEFGLGFAPDQYDELTKYLVRKGIDNKILLKSGLAGSKGDKIYDKFRSRLIFPIYDYFGKVCGFGGRALKSDQVPKYLNSPENPIYSKGKLLYGLSFAKEGIKESGKVVLVEGYFDVILPWKAGVKNVAATSGTALTADQARLLKRITTKVVSCFDSDEAGFEATRRAYQVLSREEIDMSCVVDLKEKDPADLVVEGGDFVAMTNNSKDFVVFFLDKLVEKYDTETLDGRKHILAEILPILKEMTPTTRDYYVRTLAKYLNSDEKVIYGEIENFNLPASHPASLDEVQTFSGPTFTVHDVFLGIVFEHPKLFKEIEEKVPEDFFDSDLQNVYKELHKQYNRSRDGLDQWDFEKGFLAECKPKIDILRLYADERYGEFAEEILIDELQKLIDKMKNSSRTTRLKQIQSQISELEKSGEKEKLMELLQQQQELLRAK